MRWSSADARAFVSLDNKEIVSRCLMGEIIMRSGLCVCPLSLSLSLSVFLYLSRLPLLSRHG